MATAILHIGTEKTGSTALQSYLWSNRAALRLQDYVYPVAAGDRNHLKLAAYSQADDVFDDLRLSLGVTDGAGLKTFRSALEAELAAEVANAPSSVFVFSSEHCHSRLIGTTDVARLHGLLAPLFSEIRVVVYLRRQDELAVSLYSTMLKAGGTRLEIIPGEAFGDPYYDHAALLDRWGGTFGRDRLQVNIFQRSELADGSVIADFCRKNQIPVFERHEVRGNESLQPGYQEFLRQLNHYLRPLVEGIPHSLRGNLGEVLARVGAGLGRLPALSTARAFYDSFQLSNERVRAEFFPARPTLFTEDFSRYPETESLPSLDLDGALAITAQVLLVQQDEIRLLQAENGYLSGRVDLGQGKHEGAERKFRFAVKRQPDHARAWHFLARTLLEGGRIVEARSANAQALELDPGNEMFARLETKLGRLKDKES